ncbi:MAG: cytochrome b [Gammaproteobacteria bacterium]|jgi:cytochrome b561
MRATNTATEYGWVTRVLHWLMALLILGMIALGAFMGDVPKTDSSRLVLFTLHMSTGVVLLVLILLRSGWHLYTKPPKEAENLWPWEHRLAWVIQRLMYLCMLLVPIAGYLMVSSAGHKIPFYGLLQLPEALPKVGWVHEFFEGAHSFLAYSLLVLVIVHVAGAIKHRYIDGNDVVERIKLW